MPTENTTTPTSSTSHKTRKGGSRKANKLHAGIFAVEAVDQCGAPVEPKCINAKWRNDCGVLVRENLGLYFMIGIVSRKKKE